jgi:uncharacterized membrane protein HdeD (DUF308 family)
MLALRGLVAIAFGILAFVWPRMTLLALVFMFGIYALFDGILALTHAFSAPKGYPRFGSLIFNGLFSIAAGVLAFAWPGITALVLLLLIAAWAIATGICEIVEAIRLRKEIAHEWLLVLAGIISVLFGIAIVARPAAGALAVVWWIGGFAVVFGALVISLAFRLRRWGRLVLESPTGI